MSHTPADRKYARSHEWIKLDGDGIASVGISEHAQDALGDLVFVELPEVGTQVSAGAACAVVESVKAASDIYSPATGEILAVNEQLVDAPETINADAHGAGWLFKLRLVDPTELDDLLDAEGYRALVAENH